MKACWYCGTESMIARPSRDQICAKCKVALKCCKNCKFFDSSAHNQCREPAAEWVRDKDLANFCEYFEFNEAPRTGTAGSGPDPRKAFDSLFGKK